MINPDFAVIGLMSAIMFGAIGAYLWLGEGD